MFGVSLTKNGIFTASRTHNEIFLTRTGSCHRTNLLTCELNSRKFRSNVYLATSQSHAWLSHSVRTRQVQFQCIRPGLFCFRRQLNPFVSVVGAHDTRYDHLYDERQVQLTTILLGPPVVGSILPWLENLCAIRRCQLANSHSTFPIWVQCSKMRPAVAHSLGQTWLLSRFGAKRLWPQTKRNETISSAHKS